MFTILPDNTSNDDKSDKAHKPPPNKEKKINYTITTPRNNKTKMC